MLVVLFTISYDHTVRLVTPPRFDHGLVLILMLIGFECLGVLRMFIWSIMNARLERGRDRMSLVSMLELNRILLEILPHI